MNSEARRLAILAEGMLDFHHGKTATSLVRYRPDEVTSVIDSQHCGQKVGAVLGFGGDIPIVANVDEALTLAPNTLLIGIAPRGGGLPLEWRRQILTAIGAGLDIVSGLHYMLAADPEFAVAARRAGVTLLDVRRVPEELSVAELAPHRSGSHVITFVGSDCAVGKMTAALEVTAAAVRDGMSAEFLATGQTGIMLEGGGVAIDRVIGDFMAGAIEALVVQASERVDWVFVEGQGSLFHPGYSGVTLALLHGSSPDAMVLVHQPGHATIDDYPVVIPPLIRMVQAYESAAAWVKPAFVVGIALNTRHLDQNETERAIDAAERESRLPATDPVKFGGEKLLEAAVKALTSSQAE